MWPIGKAEDVGGNRHFKIIKKKLFFKGKCPNKWYRAMRVIQSKKEGKEKLLYYRILQVKSTQYKKVTWVFFSDLLIICPYKPLCSLILC